MIDLNAPIIPGESAAGIVLGSSIQSVLLAVQTPFQASDHPIGMLYLSEAVDLWVAAGYISQIRVHGSYTGKLMNLVGIGSTIRDVETLIGAVLEDEEDNLVIEGVPGFCFEIDVDANPSTITEFYVFNLE